MYQEIANEPSLEQTDSKAGPLRSAGGGTRGHVPPYGGELGNISPSHQCNGNDSKSSGLVCEPVAALDGSASDVCTGSENINVDHIGGATSDKSLARGRCTEPLANGHDDVDIKNTAFIRGSQAIGSVPDDAANTSAAGSKEYDVIRLNEKCSEDIQPNSEVCAQKSVTVPNGVDEIVGVHARANGNNQEELVENGKAAKNSEQLENYLNIEHVPAANNGNTNGSADRVYKNQDLNISVNSDPDIGGPSGHDTVAVYNGAKNNVKTLVSRHSLVASSKPVGCGKNVFSFMKKKKKRNPSSSSSVSASPSSSSMSSASSGSSSSSSASSSEDELIPRSPDGGWGWMIVLASFITHLIADGCSFSFGIMFAELLDAFEESKFKTAWVGSLFVSMPAICGPIASILTNLLGCRKTAALGGVIAALGCFLSFFATSIDMLCITYGVVAGFGLSLVYVPAVVIVAFYFEKKRSFATGIAVSGSGIGTFIFAPLTEQLIEVFTWKGTMLVMSGLMLNIVVCATLFRPLVAQKLVVRQRRYLRSLERFSRVSSRIQSHDALDRRSVVCGHGNDDDDDDDAANCVFCRTDIDLEPLSLSLIELPTYLSSRRSTTVGHDLCVANSSLLKVRRQSSLSLNLASCGGAGHSQHPTVTVVTESKEQSKVITGASNQIDEIRQKEYGLETDIACMGFVDPMRGNFISEENNIRASSGNEESTADQELHKGANDHASSPVAADTALVKSTNRRRYAGRKTHHGGSLEAIRVKKSPGQFPLRFVPQCRTDIFYRGSLLKAGFLLSRGQSASCPDVYVHTPKRRRSRRAGICHRLHAMGLRSVWEAVKEACDFSIFRSAIFISFCVHSLLLYLSYDIPYVYIPDMATSAGIPVDEASFLISIIGITSTFGQVAMGYFGDRSYINCFYFYIGMILLAGAPILFVPILKTYSLLATFCALFGFFMSANYALTTIIVVDLLGMEQLTNAYGFVSLAEGLANLVGPPIAGFIADESGYNIAFYLAGAGICLSALILLVVPLLRRCDKVVGGGRKSKSRDEEAEGRRSSRATAAEGGGEDGSEEWREYGGKRNKEGLSIKSDSSSENHVRFSVDF